MMRFTTILLLVVGTVFIGASTQAQEVTVGYENSKQEPVVDTPVAELELKDGTQVKFYATELQGAAVLELGKVGRRPILDSPELEDSTPAEVFWAITKPGTKIPELLRAHHDRLARDGQISRDGQGYMLMSKEFERTQGWFEQLRQNGPLESHLICSNAVFAITKCAHPSYSNHKCFLDWNGGNMGWNAARADRYKAALCVKSGTVFESLNYTSHNPWGACGVGFPIGGEAIQWQGNIGTGGALTFVWWAGSNDWWRTYKHRTTNASGDVFHHGQRWRRQPNCK